MGNKIIFLVLIIIVIFTGIYFWTQGRVQINQTQEPTTTIQETTVIPTTELTKEIEEVTIAMKDFAYDPKTITVKQGTKVIWTNNDMVIHDVKSDTFTSGDLNKGDSFEYVFDQKGSFDYLCTYHSSMTGTIIVE